MYFRQQPQPSTTVLQISGHLTIHHPHTIQSSRQHQRPHLTHEKQYRRNQRQDDRSQHYGFRKEGKQPSQAQPYQPKQVPNREQKRDEQEKRKTKQANQKQNHGYGELEIMRNLGERLHKMEETWGENIGVLNFETLYQLREMQEKLEIQNYSLLNQQVISLQEANQHWKQQMEKERKLFAKEKQQWKAEKQQLIKDMESMMEEMLEEQRREAHQMAEEKFAQLNRIFSIELKTEEINMLEKVEERLNLRVNKEVNRHEELDGELEVLSHKFHELAETCTIFPSSKINAAQQEEEVRKLKSMIDRTTPCARNFQLLNTISLRTQHVKENTTLLPQTVWLNEIVGEETFTFLIRIHQMRNLGIFIGVGDRATQKDKETPEFAHSICYHGVGAIHYGTGKVGESKHQIKQTYDRLNSGMDVLVEVDRRDCAVTFTLQGPSYKFLNGRWMPVDGAQAYRVNSPILKQHSRQFSPFFVMLYKGDSLSYWCK